MKDISVIPKGIYCHGATRNEVCPYWSLRGNLPEQENGYCAYLEKSDWDLNEESDKKYGGWDIYDPNKYKVIGKISAHDCIGSLLWDQCKECGINGEN